MTFLPTLSKSKVSDELQAVGAESLRRTGGQCADCAVAGRLAELRARMAHFDRLKNDFVQIASHELRTPIAVVKGYVGMLETYLPPETAAELKTVYGGIAAGIDRLECILEAILLVSQVGRGELRIERRPYPIVGLIRQALDDWSAALVERELQFDLVVDLPGQEALWKVDPLYLELALRHLFQNAIKFTPDGGFLGCRVSLDGSGCLRIEVTDTGIGIEDSQRELIFEKFYRVGDVRLHSSGRTKFMGAGPGLGLYLVRGIVEAHRGSIWVESNGETGSRFVMRLPGTEECAGENLDQVGGGRTFTSGSRNGKTLAPEQPAGRGAALSEEGEVK